MMTNNISVFIGSIPDLYDRNVDPLVMVPYAGDICRTWRRDGCWKLRRAPASSLVRWRLRYRAPSLSPLT